MDPLEFLESVGGVARVGLLRRHGYSARDVRGLSRAGAVQPRNGIWALSSADPEFLAALTANAVLTCASAALRYNLWLKSKPGRLHLSSKNCPDRQVANHRGLRFPVNERLPLASLEDAVIHGLTCLGETDAIAMAQSALRLGVPREILAAEIMAKYFGTARRRLAKADGLSESVPEISARLIFEGARLSFRRQVQINDVGRVDFLIEGWLIVEVNGFQFHSSRAAWRKDMSRLNAAQGQGFAVLSYSPEQIWNNSELVVAEIRAMLARRS